MHRREGLSGGAFFIVLHLFQTLQSKADPDLTHSGWDASRDQSGPADEPIGYVKNI